MIPCFMVKCGTHGLAKRWLAATVALSLLGLPTAPTGWAQAAPAAPAAQAAPSAASMNAAGSQIRANGLAGVPSFYTSLPAQLQTAIPYVAAGSLALSLVAFFVCMGKKDGKAKCGGWGQPVAAVGAVLSVGALVGSLNWNSEIATAQTNNARMLDQAMNGMQVGPNERFEPTRTRPGARPAARPGVPAATPGQAIGASIAAEQNWRPTPTPGQAIGASIRDEQNWRPTPTPGQAIGASIRDEQNWRPTPAAQPVARPVPVPGAPAPVPPAAQPVTTPAPVPPAARPVRPASCNLEWYAQLNPTICRTP
jgi:hypothetical protein